MDYIIKEVKIYLNGELVKGGFSDDFGAYTYLLENLDHYIQYEFRTFYKKEY